MSQLETMEAVEEKNDELNEQLLLEKRRRAALRRKQQRRRARRRRRMILALMLFSLIVICAIVCFMLIKGADRDSSVNLNIDYLSEESGESSGQSVDEGDEDEIDEEEIEEKRESAFDFSHISFSDESKSQRYALYKGKNPELSDDEVVWHVNSNLDKPKYEHDIEVSGYNDVCILVNKYYKVPDGYRPPDLKSFDGQLLREVAGNAYTNMRNDALKEGLKIRVVSGYRTVEYQRGLYNRYLSQDSKENVDRYSARPGHSEHHTGLAMDLFGSQDGLRNFKNTPEYGWVKENCYKYGFIIRYLKETEHITGYEDEPWHLRYVGVDVSTDMKEKNINTFEEYHVKYLE